MELARTAALVDRFRSQRVAVVGDFYLDVYHHARVAGVSPEMPVLRLVEERREHVPGAAGNVAANLAALGAAVLACGCIGPDPEGRSLRAALEERGIDPSCLESEPGRSTGTFSRVLVSGSGSVTRTTSATLSAFLSFLMRAMATPRPSMGWLSASLAWDFFANRSTWRAMDAAFSSTNVRSGESWAN